MNREDIIRMAREAGAELAELPRGDAWLFTDDECLERFAALVAKHTLANIDPSSFMTWQEGYEVGKQTEREACADIAENWNSNGFPRTGVAEQIRARGQA